MSEWIQQSQLVNYGAEDMVRKFEEKRATTTKTKKAMPVGVSKKSGDGHPLLQAAEQFLTDHCCLYGNSGYSTMAH